MKEFYVTLDLSAHGSGLIVENNVMTLWSAQLEAGVYKSNVIMLHAEPYINYYLYIGL